MADENQNHSVRGKVGFRVHPPWQRPDAALLDAFKDIAAPQVTDSMSRLGAMDAGIRPAWPSPPIVGSALTVWLHSGDNLMLHKALSLAVPNDILVINTQSNTVNSPFGEMIAASAKKIGIVGLIIDGTVRDAEALQAMQFPAYSRGLCPNGCYKDGCGEVGAIIACGGVAVRPGDIIIADRDGVTVVPLADAPEVAKLSAAKVSSEEKRAAEIRRGVLIGPEIAERLRELNI